ncbi:MAG: oxaloacetate decarboxylase [Paludibacteraceae bacterium]|nr:oxaloacetate decarboxylase [Paludibacteraceae bacterium]MBP6283969.1 oxaloacetate decarboxylase [Paludibacteraceae bacterium]
MEKEIKFSLVYRDMWQSAGKYMPRVDQLVRVAPEIIRMGCFHRVETNGGGFEQINLLCGENPNIAVRQWCKPFNDAGIQTHMLDRSLNALRMNPVSEDVRRLFYKVKKAQGTEISRSFCGLNDTRNIIASMQYAKEAGMIAQGALSITVSPIHTVEYYCQMADELIRHGADEICLKDMAGIGRPVSLGKIVAYIKKKYPSITVQYHGQTGPGFTPASILEVCKAGCDIIDVGMEPLSWGTGHADVLMVREMLKDAGFSVPDINMSAYMKVRSLTQEFMDDFLGYFIPETNRHLQSLLIEPGLPGGMMGSLMNDLKSNLATINKALQKQGKELINTDELLIQLFDEVAYVWPRVGYPPLVTPFSQYVKNLAMFNIIQMTKGKPRWTMISDDTWDMILGKDGRLPGELAPEIKELAAQQGRMFYTGEVQALYPNVLEEFKAEMKENGWEMGEDDEELFELAMHPEQYRAYKSGKAKQNFEAELREVKNQKDALANLSLPHTLEMTVNGEHYKVELEAYTENAAPTEVSKPTKTGGEALLSPLEGRFFLTKSASDTPLNLGASVKKGDVVCYVEAMKTYNAIYAEFDGVISEFLVTNGDSVSEDDVLLVIS